MAAPADPVEAKPSPLAPSYLSPKSLLQYPLWVTNVKILCEKDGWKARKSSSLQTTILALRLTYQTEGIVGLYRGVHLHVLHQAARDSLRLIADSCFSLAERKQKGRRGRHDSSADGEEGKPCKASVSIWSAHRVKIGIKYLIDALCYPIMLASTRAIILREDSNNSWQRVQLWCREEGLFSLFSGLTCSLLSTAFEEIMDVVLEACVDRCAAGSEMGSADKLMLKACSFSVASVFTAPITHVGTIQRCQSRLPGLVQPSSLWGTVWNLPWMSSFYQLVMFGGILALNVKLIQWKLELERQEEEGVEDE